MNGSIPAKVNIDPLLIGFGIGMKFNFTHKLNYKEIPRKLFSWILFLMYLKELNFRK